MEKSEQEHRTGHFECEAVRAFADMPPEDTIRHLQRRHPDVETPSLLSPEERAVQHIISHDRPRGHYHGVITRSLRIREPDI